METIKLQGHKHRRANVYSKWVSIVNYYEKNGAKATLEQYKISRSHLYYIINQLNKAV